MKIIGKIEFSITEQSADCVIGIMPVEQGILNPYGVAHAGAILWFVDVCATVLVFGNADMGKGESGFPLGISLNGAFLGNQKNGEFTAMSIFIKKGRGLSVVRTTITGERGRIIADVTTTHTPAK